MSRDVPRTRVLGRAFCIFLRYLPACSAVSRDLSTLTNASPEGTVPIQSPAWQCRERERKDVSPDRDGTKRPVELPSRNMSRCLVKQLESRRERLVPPLRDSPCLP